MRDIFRTMDSVLYEHVKVHELYDRHGLLANLVFQGLHGMATMGDVMEL